MIDRACMEHIIKTGRALYARYDSPVGNLLIIGEDSRLLSLIFLGKQNNRHPLEKKLARGDSHSIMACRSYLDYYFRRASARGDNALLQQSVQHDTKNSLLTISAKGISLTIDCSLFTPHECRVYAELLRVPFGSTITYGDLARRSGFPGGARFIGNAMAKNMVPIIIPCHRVIKSNGAIGNYSGGVHIKEYLLALENNTR